LAFALVTGATLGRYQLLVPLGQGGMGSVWVAREASPTSGKERLVAIKVMRPEFAAHSSFRAMFLNEGQLVRSIEHDNVVRVYEVAEHEGVLWLTMEWVEGESLEVLFKVASKRRPIPAEMAVRIIADTAKGLHAAHELRGWDGELEGIVHRDVSPHNILVSLDGRIKVADFGLAKASESSGMQLTDAPHGKYSYMSPEQARGQSIDRRSDVFSLGVVLYELTTGQRLFNGVDRHHTLGLVMQCQVPPPRSIQPGYSPGLEAIVLKALANKPADRFQSADELRVALEKHLVAERTLVSTGSVAALLRRIVGKRLEKRREAIAAALVSTTGHANPELLPDTTLLTGLSHVSDVTETSGLLSQSGASETPHAISRSRSSNSLLTPLVPARRARWRLVAFGGGGAVAAFSVMLLIGKLVGERTTHVDEAPAAGQPMAPETRVRSGARPETAADGKTTLEGVSISDLPVEQQEEARRVNRAAPVRALPAPPAPAPAAKPAWLEQVGVDASQAPTPPADSEASDEPVAPAASASQPLDARTEPAGSAAEPEQDPTRPKIVLEEEEPPAPKPEPKPYKLRVPGMDRDEPGF